MIVYVVSALLVVAVLWAAYRALGRPASEPVDTAALLQRVARAALEVAQRVDGVAAGGGAAPRELRRQVDGCAQLLERVDTGALDPRVLAEHALLSGAVEDLGWALRLRESAGFVRNDGVRTAVAALREDALQRLRDAGVTGAGSARAEEVDGPA